MSHTHTHIEHRTHTQWVFHFQAAWAPQANCLQFQDLPLIVLLMGRPLGSIALEEQREIAKRAFLLLPPGRRLPMGCPDRPTGRPTGRDVLPCQAVQLPSPPLPKGLPWWCTLRARFRNIAGNYAFSIKQPVRSSIQSANYLPFVLLKEKCRICSQPSSCPPGTKEIVSILSLALIIFFNQN